MNKERCINLRELGGYLTLSNKKIKSGKLIRSGAHHQCNMEDNSFLSSLSINTLIDLRGNKERALEPTNLSLFKHNQSDSLHYIYWDYDLNFDIKTLQKIIEENPAELFHNVDKLYLEFYAKLPFEFGPRLSKLFEELMQGKTILFHCSAGKDRTGFIAFIILTILDVDYEIILQDYLLSDASHNRRKIMIPDNTPLSETLNTSSMNPIGKIPKNLSSALAGVKAEYLEQARKTVIEEFGSVLNYLKHFTNMTENDIEVIKSHYLI